MGQTKYEAVWTIVWVKMVTQFILRIAGLWEAVKLSAMELQVWLKHNDMICFDFCKALDLVVRDSVT